VFNIIKISQTIFTKQTFLQFLTKCPNVAFVQLCMYTSNQKSISSDKLGIRIKTSVGHFNTDQSHMLQSLQYTDLSVICGRQPNTQHITIISAALGDRVECQVVAALRTPNCKHSWIQSTGQHINRRGTQQRHLKQHFIVMSARADDDKQS
jgi:hypothetical protein